MYQDDEQVVTNERRGPSRTPKEKGGARRGADRRQGHGDRGTGAVPGPCCSQVPARSEPEADSLSGSCLLSRENYRDEPGVGPGFQERPGGRRCAVDAGLWRGDPCGDPCSPALGSRHRTRPELVASRAGASVVGRRRSTVGRWPTHLSPQPRADVSSLGTRTARPTGSQAPAAAGPHRAPAPGSGRRLPSALLAACFASRFLTCTPLTTLARSVWKTAKSLIPRWKVIIESVYLQTRLEALSPPRPAFVTPRAAGAQAGPRPHAAAWPVGPERLRGRLFGGPCFPVAPGTVRPPRPPPPAAPHSAPRLTCPLERGGDRLLPPTCVPGRARHACVWALVVN